MKRYTLDTETTASFAKIEDAEAYRQRLAEDEEHATVTEPRRNPANGMYTVKLFKSEYVEASAF